MVTTEHEFSEAVIDILKKNGRCMSISQIIDEIPKYIDFVNDDLIDSPSRPNEQYWQQRVRNIVSHRNVAGNIIYEGIVLYIDGKLCLPDHV